MKEKKHIEDTSFFYSGCVFVFFPLSEVPSEHLEDTFLTTASPFIVEHFPDRHCLILYYISRIPLESYQLLRTIHMMRVVVPL